jgi:hypothetical protein
MHKMIYTDLPTTGAVAVSPRHGVVRVLKTEQLDWCRLNFGGAHRCRVCDPANPVRYWGIVGPFSSSAAEKPFWLLIGGDRD